MKNLIFLLISKLCSICVYCSNPTSDERSSSDTRTNSSKEERLVNSDPKKDNAGNVCLGNDDSKFCFAYLISCERWKIVLLQKMLNSIFGVFSVILAGVMLLIVVSKFSESIFVYVVLLIILLVAFFSYSKFNIELNNYKNIIEDLNKNIFFYLECDKKSQEKLNNFINNYKYNTSEEKNEGDKKEA